MLTQSTAHSSSVEEVLRVLSTTGHGLSADEADRRLRHDGPNELQRARPTPRWNILARQLSGMVTALLIAACAAAVIIGEPVQAAAIAVVLLINTCLGFVTELRARRAIEALSRADVQRALVVRDGKPIEIDAHHLVVGDVIRVEEGRQIAADGRIIIANELRMIEATLTGESLPVAKTASPVNEGTPLAERTDMIYKGTAVAAGSGAAVVVATGMQTEIGRIGGLLAEIKEAPTPLERRLDSLGTRLGLIAIGFGALVGAVGIARGHPLHEVIQTGIALAVAAVPEGLPTVATIALAIGVHRMARRKALVRRPPSVESLGAVTVICTDKTGTLTAGEMTVTVFALPGREYEVTGEGFGVAGGFRFDDIDVAPERDQSLMRALRISSLVATADIERENDQWRIRGDPTEGALLIAAAKAGLSRPKLLDDHPLVSELPFSSEEMFMATVHAGRGGTETTCVKGAPGRVLERCAFVDDDGATELTDARRKLLERQNEVLASRGLRVLALAYRNSAAHSYNDVNDLVFAGFVGMMDRAAAGVKDTIQLFRNAGIRVVMLTGDQRTTARAVAHELGILGASDEVVDGRELAHMNPDDLSRRLPGISAFSRVSPEDKLVIVRALQQRGEVVAMLGDGVNDAAALRQADVGVSMGTRGTDVAKEAAAIVLQDDRFSTIGAAVEEGRVIFDNIRKFVFYLFSCNLAEILVLLTAGIAGLPLPLLPLQILWLNLVTDTFPALALAVEQAEPDVLNRAPANPRKSILSAQFVGSLTFYAILITAVTLASFLIGLGDATTDMPRALTMSFMTLALAQAFHLGNARGGAVVLTPARLFSNPFALVSIALVLTLQVLAVQFGPLANLLNVRPLTLTDWSTVALLSVVPALVGQLIKMTRFARWISPLGGEAPR